MELETRRRFTQDLQQLRDWDARIRIDRKIREIEAAPAITEVSDAVRFDSPKGSCYRIGIGGYQLGIVLKDGAAVLAGFLYYEDAEEVTPQDEDASCPDTINETLRLTAGAWEGNIDAEEFLRMIYEDRLSNSDSES